MLVEFKIIFLEFVKEFFKYCDMCEYLIEIVKIIIKEEEMMEELFWKKKLLFKYIELCVRVSCKMLEWYRKYIIVMCIIFVNNYIYILDYIRGEKYDE